MASRVIPADLFQLDELVRNPEALAQLPNYRKQIGGISMRAELLGEIERFVADTGMQACRLSVLVSGRPSLVSELRRGHSPTMRLGDRILAWIAIERAAAMSKSGPGTAESAAS